MPNKQGPKNRRKRLVPVIESLEPRILLSADLPGLDVADIYPDDPLNTDVDQVLAQAAEFIKAAASSNAVESNDAASQSSPIDKPEVALPSSELPDDVGREWRVAEPYAGESDLVTCTAAGAHGRLVIDATGNWNSEADESLASVQQHGVDESATDSPTLSPVDGSNHKVAVTIKGSEDAALITGHSGGAFAEDDTLNVNGRPRIGAVDNSDNPVDFSDQAMEPGDSLTGTHTAGASDGSTPLGRILINGETEAPAPLIEPPTPGPTPELAENIVSPPHIGEPSDSSGENAPGPGGAELTSEALNGRVHPSAWATENADSSGIGLNPSLPEPLEPGAIFLDVLADPLSNDATSVQKTPAAAANPTVETSQTFFQELKSFWREEGMSTSLERSETGFNPGFWSGVDKMAIDIDKSVIEQDAKMQLSAEAAAGMGISLMAGFVSWALRAGSIAASFLAAVQSWRHFDPMPILAADDNAKMLSFGGTADDASSEEAVKNGVDEMFEG